VPRRKGDFLYRVALDRAVVVRRIAFPRDTRERLPESLSAAAVERLIGSVRRPKHRAMLIRVRAGKGDRIGT
jgi:hypothetical protein